MIGKISSGEMKIIPLQNGNFLNNFCRLIQHLVIMPMYSKLYGIHFQKSLKQQLSFKFHRAGSFFKRNTPILLFLFPCKTIIALE